MPLADSEYDLMVLAVSVNTVAKGDAFFYRTASGEMLIRRAELALLGITAAAAKDSDADGLVALASLPGIRSVYDPRQMSLAIEVAPQVLPVQKIDWARPRGRNSASQTAPGLDAGAAQNAASTHVQGACNSAFLNYAVRHDSGAGRPAGFSVAAEAGIRRGQALVLNSLESREENGHRRVARLMSSVIIDQPDKLRRITAGDLVAGSGDLGSSVLLGGFSVARLYALDPYFIRYPQQSISGQVSLPTELEVVIDGRRVRSERLRPGGFELRDIATLGGVRDVQLVLRDPFGRVQTFSYPFYATERPLRRGLHEFSYAAGALREHPGSAQDHYGAPAASFFHRYGISDQLTLGGRGEASKERANAGAQATIVLGQAGVLSMAASASHSQGGSGSAVQASYSYQAGRWGASLQARHDSPAYATLSAFERGGRKLEASATFSYVDAALGSFSLQALQGSSHDPSSFLPGRALTLGYSRMLWPGASLNTSFTHRRQGNGGEGGEGAANRFWLGMNLMLDSETSVAAGLLQGAGTSAQSLQLARAQPYSGGLSYLLNLDRFGAAGYATQNLQSSLDYAAPAALLSAGMRVGSDGARRLQGSVAGSIALVDGSVAFGRPAYDSFGIVRAGDAAGVTVLVNNQVVGKTNQRGEVFLPSLSAWYENEIALRTEDLPLDYQLAEAVKRIVPAYRSGSVIDFGVRRLRAVTGSLVLADGQPVNGELRLTADSREIVAPLGNDGSFYLENLPPGRHRGVAGARRCSFEILVSRDADGIAEAGKIPCI